MHPQEDHSLAKKPLGNSQYMEILSNLFQSSNWLFFVV